MAVTAPQPVGQLANLSVKERNRTRILHRGRLSCFARSHTPWLCLLDELRATVERTRHRSPEVRMFGSRFSQSVSGWVCSSDFPAAARCPRPLAGLHFIRPAARLPCALALATSVHPRGCSLSPGRHLSGRCFFFLQLAAYLS